MPLLHELRCVCVGVCCRAVVTEGAGQGRAHGVLRTGNHRPCFSHTDTDTAAVLGQQQQQQQQPQGRRQGGVQRRLFKPSQKRRKGSC